MTRADVTLALPRLNTVLLMWGKADRAQPQSRKGLKPHTIANMRVYVKERV